LTTNEVVALTGRTRRQLDTYIRKKIVSPAYVSGPSHTANRWTPEQVSLVTHVPVLLRAGLSLEEVAALVAKGTEAVHAQLRAQYAREARENRRALKSIALRSRETEDMLCVSSETGPYLRYIPQRWMALLPMTDVEGMPGSPKHTHRLAELLKAAGVMGWGLTESSGAITSLSLDGASESHYAYAGLSSPPMPLLTQPATIDGGCYRATDSSFGARGCDGTRCDECALFGRMPTESERFEWNAEQQAEPGLSAHAQAGPYVSGIWAEHAEACEEGLGPSGLGPTDGNLASFVTAKPRLMPHKHTLPLELTACAMPAGVYLCFRCDEGRQEAAYERMMGMVSAIPQRKLSAKDELAALQGMRNMMGLSYQPDKGPVPEPFAVPFVVGDPAMAGWNQEVTQADLHRLVVPTNAAFEPEDGYCVICAALPFISYEEPIRYETQLLIRPPRSRPTPKGT
jgi:DNA-binding transcriptional MerR regulator